jgi:hypothetical protein
MGARHFPKAYTVPLPRGVPLFVFVSFVLLVRFHRRRSEPRRESPLGCVGEAGSVSASCAQLNELRLPEA